MASLFNSETSVLYFKPRAHVHPGGRNSREYLLWPAWAYRIVAPMSSERRINFIEKAVLGFCRAGIIRASEIADRIHIHTDLSAYIMKGLQEKNYIRDDGLPTKRGNELLESENIQYPEMKAGYIFQDPFTGELWPRFEEKLNYIDTERNAKGFLELIFGSKGKPWHQNVHIHFPEKNAPPFQPDTGEILRKLRQYNKAVKNAEHGEYYEDEDLLDHEMEKISLKRIDFVDEEPDPVFLTTYLYIPRDERDGFDWYVCDPFGLGYSPFLRRSIESQKDNSKKGLYSVLQRLLGKSPLETIDDHRELFKRFSAEAALETENRLTLSIRNFNVYKHLNDMGAALKEADFIGEKCSDRKLRSILNEARTSLESLFSDIKNKFPTDGVWKKLYSNGRPNPDRNFCQIIYKGASKTIGFDNIPDSLLSVQPNQIKSVADYDDGWRLRPAIMASLLAAIHQPDHPICSAAKKQPDLLDKLDNIAEIAGKGAHATERKFDLNSVKAIVENVYEIAELLLKPLMER